MTQTHGNEPLRGARVAPSPSRPPSVRARPGPVKRLWRRIRGPIAGSTAFKEALASVVAALLRFVAWTNPLLPGSYNPFDVVAEHDEATIYAFWHGQHLLVPTLNPRQHKVVALFSRSADAELNVLVARRFGIDVVRGSGGRDTVQMPEKGGARALIALKKALDAGTSVAMIADISHGARRQAGLGIVTLARISGRPIVPVAVATSRRKVLEGSWDKTAINLPFGRASLVLGEPIHVPQGAGKDDMEDFRRQVTDALDEATARAYALVDGAP
jgi:lysophospholipid acyltransferase (LPLAT)-like uncharacterized protein